METFTIATNQVIESAGQHNAAYKKVSTAPCLRHLKCHSDTKTKFHQPI